MFQILKNPPEYTMQYTSVILHQYGSSDVQTLPHGMPQYKTLTNDRRPDTMATE